MPLIIAHRGDSSHAPENTFAAFRRAIEAGADGIELDVRLSRDGVAVVCHDSSLQRTGLIKGKVADFTAAELKKIYQAATADLGLEALEAYEKSDVGKKYAMIARMWRRHWEQIIPFFNYAGPIRKVIYTTNAIENLNRQIRQTIKKRGHFPNQESAEKLVYLAILRESKSWSRPQWWTEALLQFAIQFGSRLNLESLER